MKVKTRELLSDVEAAGLAACHAAAKGKNGKFLSQRYINKSTKYLWKCSKKHEWRATFSNIDQGRWCPQCAGRVQSIEELREFAKEKGGKCISDKYINCKTKMVWECAEGHQFPAIWNHVKNSNSWCSQCNSHTYLTDKQRDKKFEHLKGIVEGRGGRIKSKKYYGKEMNFICPKGHVFSKRPSVIVKGAWCGICNLTYAEKIIRIAFETIFSGYKFPNVRPEFLKNRDGNKLELDGYCIPLKLAFEYDGEQHFNSQNNFGGSSDLEKIKERDKEKNLLCQEAKVTLLRIAYYESLEDIPSLIRDKIPQSRSDLKAFNFALKPDYSAAYNIVDPLEEYREIAISRGGKCLSNTYRNVDTHLLWECSEGHKWEAIPYSVKRNKTWCSICARKTKKHRKDSIPFEQVQEIRRLHASQNFSYNELGRKYGIGGSSVSLMVRMKTRINN